MHFSVYKGQGTAFFHFVVQSAGWEKYPWDSNVRSSAGLSGGWEVMVSDWGSSLMNFTCSIKNIDFKVPSPHWAIIFYQATLSACSWALKLNEAKTCLLVTQGHESEKSEPFPFGCQRKAEGSEEGQLQLPFWGDRGTKSTKMKQPSPPGIMCLDCTPLHFAYPSRANFQEVLNAPIIQTLLYKSGPWKVVLNAPGL